VVLGVSSEAPAWAAQQTEQAPSWARPLWSPCGMPSWLPWQIGAALRGSLAAMAAAHVAPIGARICTTSAIMMIGRNF